MISFNIVHFITGLH